MRTGGAIICRIASLEMLPNKVVASSEMLPGGRATMVPSKLRRHHEDEDDSCGAGRTG